ncbi:MULTISPECIES: DUF3541 domain-containing protein [Legionella]|uniref:DUF3541 domain-containing protein n=1 Tax=Legionella TaxID=445 RepID=UPI0009593894|nr:MULTISPECIES: DUF3541 domain-containing protein [Legionella]MBN9228077.1 DUF3541 domain-containing protein [Legionella steelei]OJW11334.1 MAG: hypothetical protein BGO44_02040 [Legionella sp. 39-23]
MHYLIVILFLFNSICHANIGERILKEYQSKLYTLPVTHQEHFAMRMYTLTGNEEYINPIINYLYLLGGRYRYLYKNLQNDIVIEIENKRLLSITDGDTEKTKRRIKESLKYPRIAYYLSLLILTNKIYFYHMEGTPLFPDTPKIISFLKTKSSDFEKFILDEENIKIYGAQLINYVYYLYDLGIIDLRKSYTKKFKKIFPDSQDAQLTDLDYAAKIYGMTHFILSESRYYQKQLNPNLFHWITEYFNTHIDEIISRTEYDVIVEVGVCLMLIKSSDSKTIDKIKAHLKTIYNKNYGILPNKENSFDLIKGEHRNILTIMLFSWPNKLTEVPKSLFQTMLEKNFVLSEYDSKIIFGVRVPY